MHALPSGLPTAARRSAATAMSCILRLSKFTDKNRKILFNYVQSTHHLWASAINHF
uniref:Uncharacterized protein n=1 Tax=Oryza punctata TaxID=4537 RepID=A0A0E0L5C1_ORYPU